MENSLSLFCFVDALGWELLKNRRFLQEDLPYRQPLDTIFGYSCTCDPTILTGLLPYQHGHFSFFYYRPQMSPFGWFSWLSWLPPGIFNRGRVRHWISRLVAGILGYTGYFQLYAMPFRWLPLFDYSEKRDLYQPGGINSGDPTIFDALRGRGQSFYLSDWRRSERENLAECRRQLQESHPSFGYLYLAELDALLHRYGCQHPEIDRKLEWYESQLASLFELARSQYESVRLYVFSDHGMTDVQELCPLRQQCEALPLRFGTDYAAVFDSTMARFWVLKEQARQPLLELLSSHSQGQLLNDDQLRAYGCLFPDRKYGEIFWLAHPGILLCPSHLGEKPLRAMHGYAPEHPDSSACLLTNQPASLVTKDLRAIYALMKAALQG